MMISAGNGFIFQSEKYSRDNAGSSLDKYILLYKGELAYNRGNSKQFPYGAIYEMKEQRALIPYVYHCFKINEDESTRYYSYYLNSAFKNEQLSKIITSSVRGNGLLNISKSDFFNLNIVVPSIAEQKKIACFLDLIEARIETQIKIIEDYETLRNTINLQVIGKKDPNTKISECLDCFSSSKKESDILVSPEGDFPAFGANGLIRRIDKYDYQTSGISIVKDGAGVGKMYYLTGKYSIVGTQNLLQSKNGYNLVYLYYALQNFDFRKYIVGSGIPHIYFKDYKNESIYIPESKKMISTISKCLASIDTKITIEKGILNRLLKQKEYLLQNLFI